MTISIRTNDIFNAGVVITNGIGISTKDFLCLNECPVLLERLSFTLLRAHNPFLYLASTLALLLALALPEQFLLMVPALALALPTSEPLNTGEAPLQVVRTHKPLPGLLQAAKKLTWAPQPFAKGRDCGLHARLPHACLPSCCSHILVLRQMTVVIRA